MVALYYLTLAAFGVSFLTYGFCIVRMMLRLPVRTWFPFGIWSFSTLKNVLGEQYDSTMRPVYFSGASTLALMVIVVLLSVLRKEAIVQ